MEEKQKKKLIIAITISLAVVLIFLILFKNFAIVNPVYSNKKIELPRITSEFAVKEIYLSQFIQELGGDKIHKNPLSGELPRINIFIKDIGKTFTTEVDEKIESYEGLIGTGDVAIEVSRKDFFEIIKANNKEEIVRNKITEGKIKIELKNSKGELASKGYNKLLKNFGEKAGFFDLISEKIYAKDVMIILMLILICSITIIYVAYY